MTDHLPACETIQEQEAADREWRGFFAGVKRPELPPFFAERCAVRARLGPSARPLSGAGRAILRAYWVLTATVGAAVFVRADWPTVPPAMAAAAVLAATAVLAPAALLAHFRGGLLALMRRILG
jgi:hypothetical protein